MGYCSVDRGDPGCLCNRWIMLYATCIEEACVLPMRTAAAFVIAGDDSKTFGTLQHVDRFTLPTSATPRLVRHTPTVAPAFLSCVFSVSWTDDCRQIPSTLLNSTNFSAVVCLSATDYRTSER